jgi:SecD/SecF fusion protein
MENITANNVGRRIAIILDDYVYSAPNVQGEIPNGSSSISGNFTIEEAKDLANILKQVNWKRQPVLWKKP